MKAKNSETMCRKAIRCDKENRGHNELEVCPPCNNLRTDSCGLLRVQRTSFMMPNSTSVCSERSWASSCAHRNLAKKCGLRDHNNHGVLGKLGLGERFTEQDTVSHVPWTKLTRTKQTSKNLIFVASVVTSSNRMAYPICTLLRYHVTRRLNVSTHGRPNIRVQETNTK
jgi:hypothetical protein